MYELIGGLRSRSFRVAWAMEELGLDYTLHTERPHSERVKNASVLGKIPVLMDGDTAISDSVAITQYLADKHGGITFGAGSKERAIQDSFTQQVCDEVDQILWLNARHDFVLPEELRVKDALTPSILHEWAKGMRNLSARLGDGPYLMGETFTVPDIILGHAGGWARNAGFAIEEPNLKDYFRRLIARDGYKAASRKRDE